jgi:hypothetical protein
MMSVFFAEVISGSMRYPLFDPWGYFVVIPLYGLHTILLLTMIRSTISNKKILYSTLYFGGVLFGLYEAYITKVLWIGLSEDSLIVFNVSIIDYIVLVFFWHPIFSFIIPVVLFEKIVSKTDYVYQGLPLFIQKFVHKKYGVFIIMLIVGFFSAFNGQLESITISELSLAIPILIMIFVIYKKGLNHQYTLDEILPTKSGIILSAIYLGLIYIGLGIYTSPEVLTIPNQIPIWISYVFFGYIFYRKLKANKTVEETDSSNTMISFREIIQYTIVILVSSIAFVLFLSILGIKDTALIITWLLWMITGVLLLIYSFKN